MICFKLFSACYDVYPAKSISHLTKSVANHSVKKTAPISILQPSLYPTSQNRRRFHTYQYTRQVYIPPHKIGGGPQCQKDGTHISTPAKSISVTSRTPALPPRRGTCTVPQTSLYPTSQHRQRTTVSKRRRRFHPYQHTRQVYISPNITDAYPSQDSILYINILNYTLESFLFSKNTFCRAQIAQTPRFLALFSVLPIKYMQTAAGCSTSTKI